MWLASTLRRGEAVASHFGCVGAKGRIQEDFVYSLKSSIQGFGLQKVAENDLYTGGPEALGFRFMMNEGANIGLIGLQILDQRVAEVASCAGDQKFSCIRH